MSLELLSTDLQQLKLHGMADALNQYKQSGQLAQLTLLEGLSLLLSHEKTYRDDKRQARLLKQAKLRQQANIESIDYDYPRKLNKVQYRALSSQEWISQAQNLVFIGATGLGKSYLACALGQLACRRGISTRYFRMSQLFEMLRIASVDGTLTRVFTQLAKTSVLILDDFALEPLDAKQRRYLLDIIEDRHGLQPLILTTQHPTEHWHDCIGDNTIADAIADRLLANCQIFELAGDSMRRNKKSTV